MLKSKSKSVVSQNIVTSRPLREFQALLEGLGEVQGLSYIPKDSLGLNRFPYCGLRHLYDKLTTTEGKFQSFGMEYYTGEGSRVHLLLQKYLALAGVKTKSIWGAWKCVNPKCLTKVAFDYRTTCPRCGQQMEYDELGVKFGQHVIGRADGLFQDSKKFFYVIDYKTSSTAAIENCDRYNSLPYKNNVAQIISYCCLFEDQLKAQNIDITIKGWFLVYLSRDNPLKTVKVCFRTITEEEKAEARKLLAKYDRHYHTVMFLETLSEAKILIKEKPCRNEREYKDKMYSFFNPCPLAENGVCFDRSQLVDLLRHAYKERQPNWLEVGRPSYLAKLKHSYLYQPGKATDSS